MAAKRGRTAAAGAKPTPARAGSAATHKKPAATHKKPAATHKEPAAAHEPAPGGADRPLTLALPKGRILDEAIALFLRAGVDLSPVKENHRRLVHDLAAPADVGGALRVYIVRDADVPTYVEHGAADAGISGRDVLEEQGRDLYAPLDLGIGRCRLSIAEPEGRHTDDRQTLHLRVATKFPNLTRRHLESRGVVAEVIKLYGSIELAPLTGLADWIVDLVSTGGTLRENKLREVEVLLEVSARLVVNRASLKLRRRELDALLGRLRKAVAAPAPRRG